MWESTTVMSHSFLEHSNRHDNRKRSRTEDHRRRDRMISDRVPLSLGKPSLRRRLEAYYQVVAPQQLADSSWPSKFDQIYEKHGGSAEREAKLQRKLAKKYGTAVSLEIVQSSSRSNERSSSSASQTPSASQPQNSTHAEDWYTNPHTSHSGVLNMSRAETDAAAILFHASPRDVEAANPWLAQTTTVLERVDKFSSYLPSCDPQSTTATEQSSAKGSSRKTSATAKQKHQDNNSTQDSNSSLDTTNKHKASFPVPPCFTEIAESATSVAEKAPYNNQTPGGPYSMLVRAMHERFAVRVMVRYGRRGIRGVLTGYVAAVDKHWNLILQDAQELYSVQRRNRTSQNSTTSAEGDKHPTTSSKTTCTPANERPQDENGSDDESLFGGESDDDNDIEEEEDDPTLLNDGKSPVERELERRRCHKNGTHRGRSLGQLLVRGDTIVLVYRATEEESQTHQTNLKSRYEHRRASAESPVGTPAACVCIRRSLSSSSQGKRRRS